ncbi:hypothetical protein HYX17_02070 [Candidatus Woesearchaeota archaeon]|nr:hypothetical protein [Candidatus Woesearchaeota archaeon]
MKRWIFLLIILNSGLASAQEINIFGQSYSIIILAPLILIAIGLLFFLFIYLKDNLPNLSKLMPKTRIKIRKKHKDKTEEKNIIDYKSEFRNFKLRADKLELKEFFSQFYGLVKDFFSYTFDIKGQFTSDYLRSNLKNKDDIISFIEKFEHIRYSGKEISKNELNSLMREFETIVGKHSKRKKIEVSFYDKLKNNVISYINFNPIKIDVLSRIKEEYFTDKLKLLRNLKIIKNKETITSIQRKEKKIEVKEIEPQISKIKKNPFDNLVENFHNRRNENRILKMIKNCGNIAVYNPDRAKEIYSEILRTYYQMPIEYEEKLAFSLTELNNKIEESIKIKEEKELNELTKKMVDIVTSKKKVVVIHDKIPFFNTKINDFIESFNHLKSKEKYNVNNYFTEEFIKFLHEIKKFESIGIKRYKKAKKNIVDELHEIINNIKTAERKGIKVIKKDEEKFIDDLKTILYNAHEIKNNENKLFEHREKTLKKDVRNFLDELKSKEEYKINNIKNRENDLIENINRLMKEKIKSEKIFESARAEELYKTPKIKKHKEYIKPELRRYEVEDFLPAIKKQNIIKIPEVESRIKVEMPRITKGFKGLDKEEKELFEKLIKVENDTNYIDHRHPVIKISKRKHTNLDNIGLSSLKDKMNKQIKNLNKEEEMLYKKLTGIS